MPVGVIVNAIAVIAGGFIGALLGERIPERLRTALPLTFGAASMGMGISLIVKLNSLPPVILALILGSAIGELCQIEKGITWCVSRIEKPMQRWFPKQPGTTLGKDDFMEKFVGLAVLFCASGTGIFGALNEGMTGDYTVLLSKSFLDFCSSGIFATALGMIVITLAVPQFIILCALYLSASFIMPLVSPAQIADFTACGGIIMLVTGFRICGIKSFPVGNMLPALILVMPLSQLWGHFFGA